MNGKGSPCVASLSYLSSLWPELHVRFQRGYRRNRRRSPWCPTPESLARRACRSVGRACPALPSRTPQCAGPARCPIGAAASRARRRRRTRAGIPPVSVTSWMASRSSRRSGCRFGPGMMMRLPFITAANGTPHAFSWNIGIAGARMSARARLKSRRAAISPASATDTASVYEPHLSECPWYPTCSSGRRERSRRSRDTQVRRRCSPSSVSLVFPAVRQVVAAAERVTITRSKLTRSLICANTGTQDVIHDQKAISACVTM